MTDLIIQLAQQAPEEGTYIVTLQFFDEDGDPVTPSAANWTLTDERGAVINNRSAVAITPLGVSATLVLTANDLAIDTNGVNRRILIAGTYNSTLGSNLPLRSQLNFVIANFIAVT